MAKSPKLAIGAVLLLCICLVVGDALHLPSPHQKDDHRQLEDSTGLKLQRIRVGSRKMATQDNKDGGRSGVVNWVMDTWRQYMTTSGEHEETMTTRRQLGSRSTLYTPLVPKGPACKRSSYGSCVFSSPPSRASRPCLRYSRCGPPRD